MKAPVRPGAARPAPAARSPARAAPACAAVAPAAGRRSPARCERARAGAEVLLLQARQQPLRIGPPLVEARRGRPAPARRRAACTSSREMRACSALLDQRLAPLGLLDLAGARQQRLEVAVLVDQLGRGLDADARHARHVVDRSRRPAPGRRPPCRAARRTSPSPRRADAACSSSGRASRRPAATSCIRSLSDETMVHVAAGLDAPGGRRSRSGRRPRSRPARCTAR